MRLSTLVLASAFAWVLTAATANADSQESQAALPETPVEEAQDAPTSDFGELEETAVEPAMDAEATDTAVQEPMEEPMVEEGSAIDEAAADSAPALETAEAPAAPEASWDDFADPEFDPTAPAPAAPAEEMIVSAPVSIDTSGLGPMAVDASGVEGRIHTVASGDTLWDISESYLGTPWVWPSIWHENDEISNPHVIEPGDRIWITSNEMRRVSEEEADQMIAAAPEDETVSAEIEYLADEDADYEYYDGDDSGDYEEDTLIAADEPLPASVEDESNLVVAMPADPMASMTGEVITLPSESKSHYASANTMRDSTKIIDSPTLRTFLTQGDEVYLELGEGEVSVGDEFTIFREVEKIRDLETQAVLGYHYNELGWLRIVAVEGEASTGVISGATGEMARRDHILPRERMEREIPVRGAMDDIEGAIVFTPGYRWLMGTTDTVVLNVGSIHGVEVGTQMEVFDRGAVQSSSQMPDTVVAQMIVIATEPESSVAFVTQTVRELEIGERVRAVMMADQFAVR